MGFFWNSLKHLAGTEMQSNDQSQPTSYKHTDHYIDLEQSNKAIGIIKLPNSLTPLRISNWIARIESWDVSNLERYI